MYMRLKKLTHMRRFSSRSDAAAMQLICVKLFSVSYVSFYYATIVARYRRVAYALKKIDTYGRYILS